MCLFFSFALVLPKGSKAFQKLLFVCLKVLVAGFLQAQTQKSKPSSGITTPVFPKWG